MALDLGELFVKIGARTDGLADAEKGINRLAGQLDRTGTQLTKALTVPLVAIGGLAVKTFADFESSMNRVRALSGATGDTLGQLEAKAREMGATTQFSATEAADAMAFLAQAGFDADQTMGALPGTLQLAAAAGIDLAQSADIVTNVLTGMNLQVEDLGRVNDVLVTTLSSTNTNLTQLGEAFKQVGPVAASAGIGIEETAAAVGLLGNAGIQGSAAGTALRNAMTRLLNPAKEAAETLNRLGVEALDSSGNLKPLDDIIRQLEQSGASTADMMQIFGLRAGPAMAALVSQGSDALVTLQAKLEDSGGTAERIAGVQMEGLKGAFRELKSAAEELQIALGAAIAKQLQGNVEGLTRSIRNLAAGFDSLSDGTKATIVQVTALTATLGPLLLVSSKLITVLGIGGLVTTFQTGASAATGATVAMRTWTGAMVTSTTAATALQRITAGLYAVMAAHPFAVVAAAIAAVSVAAIALRNHLKDLQAQIQKGNDAEESFDRLAVAIKRAEVRGIELTSAQKKMVLEGKSFTEVFAQNAKTADAVAGAVGEVAGELDDVGKSFDNAGKSGKSATSILADLGKELAALDSKAKLLPKTLDLNAKRASALESALDSLLKETGGKLTPAIEDLAEEFRELTRTMERDEAIKKVLENTKQLTEEMNKAGDAFEDAIAKMEFDASIAGLSSLEQKLVRNREELTRLGQQAGMTGAEIEAGIQRGETAIREMEEQAKQSSTVIADSFENMIAGIAAGTQELSVDGITDAFKAAFADSVREKLNFDEVFKGNIFDLVGEIGGFLQGEGGLVGAFGNAFDAILGKAGGFGSALGDIIGSIFGGGGGGLFGGGSGGGIISGIGDAISGIAAGRGITDTISTALGGSIGSALTQAVGGGLGGLGGGFLGGQLGEAIAGDIGGLIGNVLGGLGGASVGAGAASGLSAVLAGNTALGAGTTILQSAIGPALTAALADAGIISLGAAGASAGAAAGGAGAAGGAASGAAAGLSSTGIGAIVAAGILGALQTSMQALSVAQGGDVGAAISNQALDPLGVLGMFGVSPASLFGIGELSAGQTSRRFLGNELLGGLPSIAGLGDTLNFDPFKSGVTSIEEAMKRFPELFQQAGGAATAFGEALALAVDSGQSDAKEVNFIVSTLIDNFAQAGLTGPQALTQIATAAQQLGFSISDVAQIGMVQLQEQFATGQITLQEYMAQLGSVEALAGTVAANTGAVFQAFLSGGSMQAIRASFSELQSLGLTTFQQLQEFIAEAFGDESQAIVEAFESLGIDAMTNLSELSDEELGKIQATITKTFGAEAKKVFDAFTAAGVDTMKAVEAAGREEFRKLAGFLDGEFIGTAESVFAALKDSGVGNFTALSNASTDQLRQLEGALSSLGPAGRAVFEALRSNAITNFQELANASQGQIDNIIRALGKIPSNINVNLNVKENFQASPPHPADLVERYTNLAAILSDLPDVSRTMTMREAGPILTGPRAHFPTAETGAAIDGMFDGGRRSGMSRRDEEEARAQRHILQRQEELQAAQLAAIDRLADSMSSQGHASRTTAMVDRTLRRRFGESLIRGGR